MVYLNYRLLWTLLGATLLLALVSLSLRLTTGAGTPPAVQAEPTPTPITATVSLQTGAITSAMALTQGAQPQAAPSDATIFTEAVAEDVEGFNPLLTTNATTQLIARQLFPALLGQEPQTGLITPTGLAQAWEVSPDGRTYTFTLRPDLAWSDGVPVTAQDVQFSFAALVDEAVQSPYQASLAPLESLVAVDQATVVVRFAADQCAGLHLLRHPLLPSHRYAPDFSDLRTNSLNSAPTVSAGPFRFADHTPGEAIRLLRAATADGTPATITEWRYRIVADATQRVAQLLTGALDAAPIPPAQVDVLTNAGYLTLHQYPADSYSFLALNLADPQNPQPGQAEGARLPQPPHPILGDVRVRQALALALDPAALLTATYGEHHYRLTSYVLPTLPWAYAADLPPLEPSPTEAATLLTAAGWVDNDGDGVRERAGQRLTLTLITNDDSPPRIRLGELARQQWAAVGVEVQLTPLPFDQMAATLLGQTFDLAVAGWENLGPDPATNAFWHSREDQPGSGLNFVSFGDDEVDGWLDEAASLPGCAADARGERYRQVQRRLAEQVPYLFFGGPLDTWAVQAHWAGVEPGPWGR
jgi:peptide/nickel transport system substrate-binding protein